ncbi:high affinity cAMP-specific and IBMX-insensitive 3',5'-cyclic phosphodiesterase 8B-like [Tubulanus polymorphus]|uniref:high affinity cAMP-specific and IBMX-insensitive 3',5'-cyclic phosphodiesterase 8B-like n=1 Tax=Tubulanus polymorphus TaxID=672921 RepID=UPI003DA61AC4
MGCTPSLHVSRVNSDDSTADGSTQQASKKRGLLAAMRKSKVSDDEVHDGNKDPEGCTIYGPMKLKSKLMSVLLVFGKDDAQSECFKLAATKLDYKFDYAKSSDAALEKYLENHHELVIIDHRQTKHFDADALCRSIRATRSSEYTVIVAITKKNSVDKEEQSILPLLNSGFNKRYLENTNIGTCINELLTLEHNDVLTQRKLQAGIALFTALEHVSDAIEITNQDLEIEFVNPAHEKMLGFTSDEVVGKDVRQLPTSDRNSDDLLETIMSQIKKGKPWRGSYFAKRKNSENLQHNCHIIPVPGPEGNINRFVSVKNIRQDMSLERLKDGDINQVTNGGVIYHSRRKESIARIHSMTIEAPITKVINIINAAQENSPFTVSEALDKVLEILRSTELYTPLINTQKGDDQIASDLVDGLMSQGKIKRRISGTEIGPHRHSHHHIPSSPTADNCLSPVPDEIQALLDNEPNWDFDIVELERLSNYRPLMYLGLKIFRRFGVCEFLQISESVMLNWLRLIEANYHANNPYHNSTHAADVLQASAYFLNRERIKNMFDQTDEVGSLIAAVVHDVDHPGRTNAFLVNSGNEFAVLYNDLAVLESHHVSLAFQLTAKDDRVNIFKNLERDDFRSLRQVIIDMVLATEMTKHFEHLSKYCNNIVKVFCQTEEDTESMGGSGADTSTSQISLLTSPENRLLVKRMLIKCADISNPVRPLGLCKEWAKRISEEYFQQTDDEKSKGLPVMMAMFDRKTCSIPKSQMSFIDLFLSDMFAAWDEFTDVPELMQMLQSNYDYWQREQLKVDVAAAAITETEEEEDQEKEEGKEQEKSNE